VSVHGLLAVDVCLDTSEAFARWKAVYPSREELFSCMPLAWDAALQALLPPAAKSLLATQQAKFARDWAHVSSSGRQPFPGISRDEYMYAWLLVNSRTFYFVTPETEKLARHDRLVLQPVADLFNHADVGCPVTFDEASFVVTADRAYAPGEEVCVSYGRHGNDFLLVEYGFCLEENRWDEAVIDDAILPALSAAEAARLGEAGFLGNYVLDADTICYRSVVALHARGSTKRDLLRFIDDGDGDAFQDEAREALCPLLQTYAETLTGLVSAIESSDVGLDCQRQALRGRWLQILQLIRRHQTLA
jgi:SET domain